MKFFGIRCFLAYNDLTLQNIIMKLILSAVTKLFINF